MDEFIAFPWMRHAELELGVCSIPGPASHARILQFYREALGGDMLVGGYGDHVPWCAAFVGSMLYRSNNEGTSSLLARSYLLWGEHTDPGFGAVAILPRGKSWQGHVGFVTDAPGDGRVKLLGGNQSQCVTEKWYPSNRVIDYRQPTRINYDG